MRGEDGTPWTWTAAGKANRRHRRPAKSLAFLVGVSVRFQTIDVYRNLGGVVDTIWAALQE